MAWVGERFISKEEREKIKDAKKKERDYLGYLASAVDRMTPKETNYKLKTFEGE